MADARRPLGVGVLGAGPVTQAIHLPTLARLPQLFRVAAVMDVDPVTARRVADRAGASVLATTDQDEVLASPDVDVALICSPPAFHAAQVEAACAAGVRAILCEKPIATSREEAAAVARVAAASGTPIVVGAMHVFDPGWVAARAAWEATGDRAVAVRSSVVLPPNPRFEDCATHVLSRPPFPDPDLDDPEVLAQWVKGLVLGLTVHDLPLVRALAPAVEAVVRADWVAPFGAAISLRAPGVSVELLASMHGHWVPEWTLDAWGSEHHLRVEFTPSYVHAGSARAELTGPGGWTRAFGPFPSNGYEHEWRHLHEVATGRAELAHPAEDVIADLSYVLDVAEGAAEAAREAAGARLPAGAAS